MNNVKSFTETFSEIPVNEFSLEKTIKNPDQPLQNLFTEQEQIRRDFDLVTI